MEQTTEFRRRAFAAAMPVFLVSLGIVLLFVAGVTFLLGAMPPEVATVFVGGGVLLLVAGIVWGSLGGRTGPRGA